MTFSLPKTGSLLILFLVFAVRALPQTATSRKPHLSLRDDLKLMQAETGMSVAMFDHGKLSTAPIRFPTNDWSAVEIPGAIGHCWSYEGMLSPDGTLAAFPYAEVDPCPSWKTCNAEADQHYFLAIAPAHGRGVRKYPEIILPSQMCWTRDNSKLAMIAQIADNRQTQLIVLDLDSGNVESYADGKNIALTPQCWSPNEKRLVYFAGQKDYNRPGAVRILNTATHESGDLFLDNSKCPKNNFCVSPYPTWSPDGNWIAWFQEKTYWAVHPSGNGRKKLFRHGSALSPLQWSPDGRYALYADCCAFRDTWRCMCEIGRIHVRRLADNADVEISADGFQDMFIPRWTWIQTSRRSQSD